MDLVIPYRIVDNDDETALISRKVQNNESQLNACVFRGHNVTYVVGDK
jgi:hypothetical protein